VAIIVMAFMWHIDDVANGDVELTWFKVDVAMDDIMLTW
jgi:hypothetical protein